MSLVAACIGRRIGWFLSRHLFFPAPLALLFVLLVIYGGIVAMGVDAAIHYFMPSSAVKWIFGYLGAGLYLAIPHYGLIREQDMPPWLQSRDLLMGTVPIVAYIGFAVLLAFRPI